MKIVLYSQHVLGVGHYFRSLEICKALKGHDVLLVSGGPPVVAEIPTHVREFRLPELQMDSQFEHLYSSRSGETIDQIKHLRKSMLWDLVAAETPDFFITELYPFGRKAFRFELEPVLSAISESHLPPCRVISSVRDILVEKENPAKHELRVVNTLNACFDAVLIHGDPNVIELGETFGRFAEIQIPVSYTGYIAPNPPVAARSHLRAEMGLTQKQKLIVASAGGGSVGFPLLEAVLKSFARLGRDPNLHLVVFTGPFMPKSERLQLQGFTGVNVAVETFREDFLSYLTAADLSVSMGGYNTTMNILSTGVAALVYPFDQNREQRLRAMCLAERGVLKVLDAADLAPARLANQISGMLTDDARRSFVINLDGAAGTSRWLEQWARTNGPEG